MNQEQLEALSVEATKALIYDQMVIAEGAQRNILALNQILAKKTQQPVEQPLEAEG